MNPDASNEWGAAGWLQSSGVCNVIASAMIGDSDTASNDLVAMRALGGSLCSPEALASHLREHGIVELLAAKLLPELSLIHI